MEMPVKLNDMRMMMIMMNTVGGKFWCRLNGDWRVVGCLFGVYGPLRQYFSLYRAVSQREGERGEKRTDESANVKTTPTRTYYKRSRPFLALL